MIQIAILGFGTVGSGTAEVLSENKTIIEERLGCTYNIRYILDLRDFPDSPFASLVVHDFGTILNDPEVTVVAEMMGGAHPAYDFTKACLLAGKSVVTSNKEVVATFGAELCRIAQENHVRYLFEASVGGGIPIIRPMIGDLSSNKIKSICGILNGTTNYILTSMRNDGTSFEAALKSAQELGYAEANPSADVDGIDSARKLLILAALATGKLASTEDIYVEGIRNVRLNDIRLAEAFGYTVKLIAHAETRNGKLCATVAPRLVPVSCPLSHVEGVFNGILIGADMVGEIMFYGPGAGKLPTASAVTADIMDAISTPADETKAIRWEKATSADISDFSSYACRRMLIFCGTLPEEFAHSEVKTMDGFYAVIRENITEKEALTLRKQYGNTLVNIYRIL